LRFSPFIDSTHFNACLSLHGEMLLPVVALGLYRIPLHRDASHLYKRARELAGRY